MTGAAEEQRIAAAKARLRGEMRERLASVPVAERRERSGRVVERLGALGEIRGAANLLLHRPLPTEVDLDPLLAVALERGERVFAPRLDGARLGFVRVRAETRWRRSTLGTLEPAKGEALAREDLERGVTLIVVPGLAFSLRGARLGRGGGHYDRCLREIRKAGRVQVVGIAFELQILPEVPSLDHDEPVDRVVTEERLIER